MSENDYLKIKLQLLQFQTGRGTGRSSPKAQALSDLRQQLGYESVPADYDVAGAFDYQPLTVSARGTANEGSGRIGRICAPRSSASPRPNSQYALAKANGKQDVTVSANYSHVNGISAATLSVSIPLPIFDRNQGEIAQTRDRHHAGAGTAEGGAAARC